MWLAYPTRKALAVVGLAATAIHRIALSMDTSSNHQTLCMFGRRLTENIARHFENFEQSGRSIEGNNCTCGMDATASTVCCSGATGIGLAVSYSPLTQHNIFFSNAPSIQCNFNAITFPNDSSIC